MITHEIVDVIESRPMKGYVKLTLTSEVPSSRPISDRDGREEDTDAALDDLFSDMIDRWKR